MSIFPNIPSLIYEKVEADNARDRAEHKTAEGITFGPSYLAACSRQIYYKKTGQTPTNPPDAPALVKMSTGNMLHDKRQEMLRDIGLLTECEDRKEINYKGLDFVYYLDGIIEVDGEKIIIEWKTIFGRGFDAVVDAPKDDHMYQVLSYMAFEGIKKAIIIYEGRDNGLLRQHTIESNGDLLLNGVEANKWRHDWNNKIQKLLLVKQSIEDGNIPEREFKIYAKKVNGKINYQFQKDKVTYKSDWQCKYCDFLDDCQSIPDFINSEDIYKGIKNA